MATELVACGTRACAENLGAGIGIGTHPLTHENAEEPRCRPRRRCGRHSTGERLAARGRRRRRRGSRGRWGSRRRGSRRSGCHAADLGPCDVERFRQSFGCDLGVEITDSHLRKHRRCHCRNGRDVGWHIRDRGADSEIHGNFSSGERHNVFDLDTKVILGVVSSEKGRSKSLLVVFEVELQVLFIARKPCRHAHERGRVTVVVVFSPKL